MTLGALVTAEISLIATGRDNAAWSCAPFFARTEPAVKLRRVPGSVVFRSTCRTASLARKGFGARLFQAKREGFDIPCR